MPAHPDSNLYPEASGPAKALVYQHRAEQPLKLYAGWFYPFVQRVWLALEEKKIPYEYIEVNPYDKPGSLLRLNLQGLVPTLSTPAYPHPRPLYESTVILEYLEEAYPDHQPCFLPEDIYERARARIWIDYVTSRIIPSFHRFFAVPACRWQCAEYRGRVGSGSARVFESPESLGEGDAHQRTFLPW